MEIDFAPTAVGQVGAGLVVTTDVDDYRSGVGLKGAGVDAGIPLELKEFTREGGEARILFSTQPGYVYDLLGDVVIPPMAVEEGMIRGTGGVVPVLDAGTLPDRKAAFRSPSSTIPPRAQLMIMTPFFI